MFFLFGGCADKLILYPTTHFEDAGAARHQPISWGESQLDVLVARSPSAAATGPKAYLLVFIGNAARAEMVAEAEAQAWGARPVEVWVVNPPGYGNSTGPASLQKLCPAALAAFDAIAKEAAGRPIMVSGTSIGTATALHVAARRPVAGLVLRTPPPLRQFILGHFGWWNLWLIATPVALGVPSDLDSLANAAASKCPALFVLIEPDTIVPVKYQRKVFDAYAGEKKQIVDPDADHNTPLSEEAQKKLEAEVDWLWKKIVDKGK